MNSIEFLRLPIEMQIAIACGYVAYSVSYVGLCDRQRPIDVAGISLAFSVIAWAILHLIPKYVGLPMAIVLAFAGSVVAAVAWRKFGRGLLLWALRFANVTWSDDEPSALATLSANTKYKVSQVAVQLDDGSWMCCDETWRFADAPFGPFQLGPNGDVALYVTSIIPENGSPREQATVRDEHYGDRITYIPASRVRQITVRHVPKSNRSSREAASVALSRSGQPEPSAAP